MLEDLGEVRKTEGAGLYKPGIRNLRTHPGSQDMEQESWHE